MHLQQCNLEYHPAMQCKSAGIISIAKKDKKTYLRGVNNMMQEIFIELLKVVTKENASDMYLQAGSPPVLRIEGELCPIKMDKASPEQTEALANEIMNEHQRKNFLNCPEANFIHSVAGVGRFRINIYKQRGSVSFVIRKVRDDVPTIDELMLPPVLKDIAMFTRGLVLVTGPTGSGKSTTMAAMLDWINDNRSGHIITIEDPIEYLHKDKRCLISQREIGTDTNDFSDALKNVVRQTPDVVMVGEMRDRESVAAATFFAETGHLVLSSLHSSNTTQAIERVVQFFPAEMHTEIFMQLSLNLKAILSQRLVPKADGTGRVAAIEILVNNARMKELIRQGEFNQIKREIDLFTTDGMQSMDMSLFKLFQEEMITMETALAFADSPNDLRLRIKTMPKKTVDMRG